MMHDVLLGNPSNGFKAGPVSDTEATPTNRFNLEACLRPLKALLPQLSVKKPTTPLRMSVRIAGKEPHLSKPGDPDLH